MTPPLRRQYERHIVTWDRKFEQRQQQRYAAEDTKINPKGEPKNIEKFFAQQATSLDPPAYLYDVLREYLAHAKEADLEQKPASPPQDPPFPRNPPLALALINDRRDTTGWKDDSENLHYARNWEEYESYPPSGEARYYKLLDVALFYGRLEQDVCISSAQEERHTDWAKRQGQCGNGAERRVMYSLHPNTLCTR